MHRSQLVKGLAVAFAAMTAALVVVGIAVSPVVLVLALLFGFMTYVFYMHASGRLMGRLYRGVEERARSTDGRGFRAGPREAWTPPRGGRSVSEQARRRAGDAGGPAARTTDEPAVREAYQRLGLGPDADEATVRRAYRERIKQVHPDAEDGDAEEFKRVQEAYDRLTE